MSAQQRPTPPTPVPPTDSPVLTSAQMRSARVVSDMRATNRVLVRPNETVVYRLADCDVNNPKESCYIAISASVLENPMIKLDSTESNSFSKVLFQQVNRSMTLQCSVSAFSNIGGEMAKLVQNIGVTFHTNNDRAPLTVNWGNNNDTWSGALFRWLSINGPNSSVGWGAYVPMQARIDTTAVGQAGFYLINVWISGNEVRVGVALNISSSGWGCS